MFCHNCGKQISNDSRFCVYCGATQRTQVSHENNPFPNLQRRQFQQHNKNGYNIPQLLDQMPSNNMPPNNNGKGRPKLTAILLVAFTVVVIAASASVGYIVIRNGNLQSWDSWVSKYEKEMDNYYLSAENQEAFSQQLASAKNAKDKDSQREIKEQLKQIRADAEKDEQEYLKQIEEAESKLENYKFEYAFEDELDEVKTLKLTFETLRKEKKYDVLLANINRCIEIGENTAVEATGINIDVVQKDISNFPNIKFYVDVRDASTGNPIDNLAPNVFFLSRQQASDGQFVKQQILQANQINEKDNINVNLVADVSGSMDNNMGAVKQTMKNFLATIQFGVGDQIALTAFSDTMYVINNFTTDKNALYRGVDSLKADGGTKLYDTLIQSVYSVQAQSGARCVIAFTDGDDNCSGSSPQDVINVANQCGVPIFIVGLGYNSNALATIASQTGGAYYSINDASTELANIYNNIYARQKQLYCIEYTIQNANIEDVENLHLYIRDGKRGGKYEWSYNMREDYFNDLLSSFLTDYITALNTENSAVLTNSPYINNAGTVYPDVKRYIESNYGKLTEQLISSRINSIEKVADGVYKIKTTQSYDIVQLKDYNNDIRNNNRDKEQTDQIKSFLYNYSDYQLSGQKILVYKRVTGDVDYTIKYSNDGGWQIWNYEGKFYNINYDVHNAYVYGYTDRF